MDNFVEYGRLFAPHVNVLNFCSQFILHAQAQIY